MKTKYILLGLMTYLSMFPSCKPKKSSDTKNVSALIAGSSAVARDQLCESKNTIDPSAVWGTQVKNLDQINVETVKTSVLSALGAAPAIMSETFLAKNVLTNNLATGYVAIHAQYNAELCKDRSQKDTTVAGDVAQGPATPAACWGLDPSGHHAIHIFANPKVTNEQIDKLLHNYLLVEVGFLFDGYMNFLAKEDKLNELQKEVEKKDKDKTVKFEDLKKRVADYQSFKKELAEKLGRKDATAEIQSLLMAEAVDAYYCSQKTRKEFSEKLKDAHDLFAAKASTVFGDTKPTANLKMK